MLSELERRPVIGNNEGHYGDELEKEIRMLLREQRQQEGDARDDREQELNIYRIGSAPPTVEGSLSVVGGLFGGRRKGSMTDDNSGRAMFSPPPGFNFRKRRCF